MASPVASPHPQHPGTPLPLRIVPSNDPGYFARVGHQDLAGRVTACAIAWLHHCYDDLDDRDKPYPSEDARRNPLPTECPDCGSAVEDSRGLFKDRENIEDPENTEGQLTFIFNLLNLSLTEDNPNNPRIEPETELVDRIRGQGEAEDYRQTLSPSNWITALSLAARGGFVHLIQGLHETMERIRNADVDPFRDDDFVSMGYAQAILEATSGNQLKAVSLLFELGGSVPFDFYPFFEQAVRGAISLGKPELLKVLLTRQEEIQEETFDNALASVNANEALPEDTKKALRTTVRASATLYYASKGEQFPESLKGNFSLFEGSSSSRGKRPMFRPALLRSQSGAKIGRRILPQGEAVAPEGSSSSNQRSAFTPVSSSGGKRRQAVLEDGEAGAGKRAAVSHSPSDEEQQGLLETQPR